MVGERSSGQVAENKNVNCQGEVGHAGVALRYELLSGHGKKQGILGYQGKRINNWVVDNLQRTGSLKPHQALD